MISEIKIKNSSKTVTHHTLSKGLALILLITASRLVEATPDEANSSPQFDLGALASLASNPQLISMIGTLFNQPQKSGISSSAQSDSIIPEPESNSITHDTPSSATNEPLRRVTTQQVQEESKRVETPQSSTQAIGDSRPLAPPNPLGGLMSLIPNLLPGLDPNILSTLTGAKSTQPTPPAQQVAGPFIPITVASRSSKPLETNASPSASYPVPGSNTAQTVINQVLSAYAQGQIPSELIQLSLSGRVPPSIVAMALSGQVPPQVIQMVITGKIPISTINTFLDSMQVPVAGSRAAPAGSTPTLSIPGTGLLSTTRSIFEALFANPFKVGKDKTSLTVPTLLGPVPIQLPNLPSVRKFGQLVGGTISNVSSLVPF